MSIKLDFEQRHRANVLIEWLASEGDIEEIIFELIALRDSYNKMRRNAALLRYADNSGKYSVIPVIKNGKNISTVGNVLADMYA